MSPTVAELIAAGQQLIARAHARALKVLGATLTPFEGAIYQTAVGEARRSGKKSTNGSARAVPTTT